MPELTSAMILAETSTNPFLAGITDHLGKKYFVSHIYYTRIPRNVVERVPGA
jgi:hypothetical protein